MLGANFWPERGDNGVGVFSRFPLRRNTRAQIDHIVAHGRENLGSADSAVAGHNDGRLPARDFREDFRPARAVDTGIARREPWKDRKNPLLGEIAGKENTFLRQPYDLIARGMGETPGTKLDRAATQIDCG